MKRVSTLRQALLTASVLLAYATASAQTALPLGQTITRNYPGAVDYVVPPGARRVSIRLVGANGGGSVFGIDAVGLKYGGRGAIVDATFCVDGANLSAGDVLRVGVGASGESVNGSSTGGFVAFAAGGGGGASGVFKVEAGGGLTALMVAGGGGGSYSSRTALFGSTAIEGGDAPAGQNTGTGGGEGRRGGGGGGRSGGGGNGGCAQAGGGGGGFLGAGGQACGARGFPNEVMAGNGGNGYPGGGGGAGNGVSLGGGGGGGATGGRDGGNNGAGDGGTSYVSPTAAAVNFLPTGTKSYFDRPGAIAITATTDRLAGCNYVQPEPSCPYVSDIRLSNITSGGVLVTFDTEPEASGYVATVFPRGADPATAPPAATADVAIVFGVAFATVGGLSSGTEYDVYVQAKCGLGRVGFISTPAAFETGPGCGQVFYDSGGPNGSARPFENATTTIIADPGYATVTAAFQEFIGLPGTDILRVYDGPDASSPLIATLDGLYGAGFQTLPGPITSSGRELTFVFTNGAYATGDWRAQITCTPRCAPVAAASLTDARPTELDIAFPTTPGRTYAIKAVSRGQLAGASPLASLSGATSPATLTGLPAGTEVDVYVRPECPSGLGPYSPPLRTATETPRCRDIFDISVTGVRFTEVDLYLSSKRVSAFQIVALRRGDILGSDAPLATILATAQVGNAAATIRGLPAGTELDIYARTYCDIYGGVYGDFYDDVIRVRTPDYTCAAVTDVRITEARVDELDLTFAANPNAENYEVVAVRRGQQPDVADALFRATGPETSLTLTGLPFVTDIDVYVRGFCSFGGGLTSPYAGPVATATVQPPCPFPTGFVVTDVTTQQVTATWDDHPDVLSWQVVARERGADPNDRSKFLTSMVTYTPRIVLRDLPRGIEIDLYTSSYCPTIRNEYGPYFGPFPTATLMPEPVCGSRILDPGGDRAYPGPGRTVTTVCPDQAGERVTMFLVSGATPLEPGDRLLVHDGPTEAAPLIHTFTGWIINETVRAENASGCLTFVFDVVDENASGADGYAGFVRCEMACPPPPSGSATLDQNNGIMVEFPAHPGGTTISLYTAGADPDATTPSSETTVRRGFQRFQLSHNFPRDIYLRRTCGNFTSARFGPIRAQAPVPAELTSFTASAKTDHTALAWSTASEVDVAAFVVERAGAEQIWREVAEVRARGSSGTGADYVARDAPPTAETYYRLRIDDLDGSVAYSDVVTVTPGGTVAGSALRVYPNPARDYAEVVLPSHLGASRLRVVDAVGRVVVTHDHGLAAATLRLDLGALPSGMYTVVVEGSNGTQRAPLVVE